MNFNIKKSIGKAIKTILIVVVPLIVAGLSIGNISILDMIGKIFPILSSLTVSGLIAVILNYLKVKENK